MAQGATIHVRMDQEMVDRLDEEVGRVVIDGMETLRITRSDLVRFAVLEYLEAPERVKRRVTPEHRRRG